jgi:hypothetical protein
VMDNLSKQKNKRLELSKVDKVLFNGIALVVLLTCVYFFLKVLFL